MNRSDFEAEVANLIPQKELARLLHVTTKTLIFWNKTGIKGRRLAKVRIGRHVYYRPEDVSRFQEFISG